MWSFSPCPWRRHLLRFQLWNNPVSLLLVNSTLLYLSQIKEMETPVLSAASICNCKSATEIYIILPQDKSKFTCRITIYNPCISLLDWSFNCKWLLADVLALKRSIQSYGCYLWRMQMQKLVLYCIRKKEKPWCGSSELDCLMRNWEGDRIMERPSTIARPSHAHVATLTGAGRGLVSLFLSPVSS